MPNIILIKNEYNNTTALRNVLAYVLRKSIIYGGYGLDVNYAFEQMCLVKEVYHKTDGCQLLHVIIAFKAHELQFINFDGMTELCYMIGDLLKRHQMVYAVHCHNTSAHLHLAINTINFVDGRRLSDANSALYKIKALLRNRLPRCCANIYYSYPNSECNRYTGTIEDYGLQIDD